MCVDEELKERKLKEKIRKLYFEVELISLHTHTYTYDMLILTK